MQFDVERIEIEDDDVYRTLYLRWLRGLVALAVVGAILAGGATYFRMTEGGVPSGLMCPQIPAR
jgi:hypothetical protein